MPELTKTLAIPRLPLCDCEAQVDVEVYVYIADPSTGDLGGVEIHHSAVPLFCPECGHRISTTDQSIILNAWKTQAAKEVFS